MEKLKHLPEYGFEYAVIRSVFLADGQPGRLEEQSLIAYYQGRVKWEELFFDDGMIEPIRIILIKLEVIDEKDKIIEDLIRRLGEK